MDRLLQFALSNAVAAMALAICAAGVSRIVKRPPVTRALWILVLLKLFTPPVWTIPLSIPTDSTPTVADAAITPEAAPVVTIADQPADPDLDPAVPTDAQPPAPLPQLLAASHPAVPKAISWTTILITLWIAGSLAISALVLRSTLRLRRIIRQSVPAPLGIRRRATHLARLMGLTTNPQILFARGPLPPMLCATGFRPRIILPASLWSKLDDAQQDTVLIHELAHLRHGDHWVRRLELIAAVLYWWHPAVWWSRSHLRESSEQCCDAWVVWTLPRLARSYAEALVETVDFISLSRPSLPVLASGMGQFTDLKRRLVMINQGRAPRALSRTGYASVFSLAGLLLPLAPSFAQEAAPEAPSPRVPPTPAIVQYAPADSFAPVAPTPAPAPKADILVAPVPNAYSGDSAQEQDVSPRPREGQGRDEIDRARAQVEKLRAQLRDAERRLSELQRGYQRFEADQDRNKAMAEAQKERAKALAQAAKERAKAAVDRARAMEDRKRAFGEVQNDGFAAPKPKVETNFQYRAEPSRSDEYVRAGARLKAVGGADQNRNDALERRLDQLEKQLDEMVGQLRQMKRQVARPNPTPADASPRKE